MKRRDFIALMGGAAATWPLAALGQQQGDRVRRLAAINGRKQCRHRSGRPRFLRPLGRALEDLGWVEGRNFRADYRWPSGDVDRMEAIAKEFIDLKPP